MLTLVACLKKRADFYENIDLWKMNNFWFPVFTNSNGLCEKNWRHV